MKKVPVCLKIQEDKGHRGRPSSDWLEAGLVPPTLHSLQADLSAQQTCIGRVVPQGARIHAARRQLELVDEGGALVGCVVYPEIELRIGEPARAAVDPEAEIDVERRPGIDSARRNRVGLRRRGWAHARAMDTSARCHASASNPSQN